jgi:hypothetical protein
MGQKTETSEVFSTRICLFIIARPQQVPLHMNNRVPLRNHSDTQSHPIVCVVVRCCRNGEFFTIVSFPSSQTISFKTEIATHINLFYFLCNLIEMSEHVKYQNWNKPYNRQVPYSTGNTPSSIPAFSSHFHIVIPTVEFDTHGYGFIIQKTVYPTSGKNTGRDYLSTKYRGEYLDLQVRK